MQSYEGAGEGGSTAGLIGFQSVSAVFESQFNIEIEFGYTNRQRLQKSQCKQQSHKGGGGRVPPPVPPTTAHLPGSLDSTQLGDN